MGRGGADQVRVHFKGADEDFLIFVDDVKAATQWKTDKTIALAQVVSAFKIFVTHNKHDKDRTLSFTFPFTSKESIATLHGAQGPLNAASNATLENEFGTSKPEEVIKQILEKGTIQETDGMERGGTKNDSIGSRGGH